jgi:hypothetical protein
MYIVKNVSNIEVPIEDLRMSLKSNQQQDLDMICSRSIAEKSGDLRKAIAKGYIKIVFKDGTLIGNKVRVANSKKEPQIVPPTDQSGVLNELRQLEKRLNERHDAIIKKHLTEAKGLDSKTTETLNAAIDALKSLAGQSKDVSVKNEDESIDESKAIDIQKRVINRVAKDSKGNIRSDDSKEKSNIDKNIDELGDLLG